MKRKAVTEVETRRIYRVNFRGWRIMETFESVYVLADSLEVCMKIARLDDSHKDWTIVRVELVANGFLA